MTKELAPRGGFEPPTFRLTASRVILSKLAGIGLNRRQSASCDETEQVLFSFSTHLLFTICQLLWGLAGHSCDNRDFFVSPPADYRATRGKQPVENQRSSGGVPI